ncbi:hypothetical protein K443DRAFT_442082 [Laccaria amethystina LaAM-08-1]|uniref:Uncharacterized protein n=1 Tax=Laccaria amethystina LaAM-08-1 TaxID=1095629 RepID=A0A0C9XGG1_9AGAR|nr:hypothetical protein K443DRAFT_442082 [Laccaria amethystina LaAM-08-1]
MWSCLPARQSSLDKILVSPTAVAKISRLQVYDGIQFQRRKSLPIGRLQNVKERSCLSSLSRFSRNIQCKAQREDEVVVVARCATMLAN